MNCVLLFLWLTSIALAPTAGTPLAERVTSYWKAMAQGRLTEASELVDPAARDRFLNRRTLPVVGWKIDAIRQSRTEARVTLNVKFGSIGGVGLVPGRVEQSWKRIQDDWYLEVPAATPSQLNRWLYGSVGPARVRSGTLSAQPSALTLHFLNPVQRGRVTLSNGLGEKVILQSCSASTGSLSVHPGFRELAPGQSAFLTVEVEGKEDEKNRSATIRCLFWGENRTIPVEVPVLFNYISAEEKAFFGLTEEQAQKLRHGDKVEATVHPPR
jgi:hypothetical protein